MIESLLKEIKQDASDIKSLALKYEGAKVNASEQAQKRIAEIKRKAELEIEDIEIKSELAEVSCERILNGLMKQKSDLDVLIEDIEHNFEIKKED